MKNLLLVLGLFLMTSFAFSQSGKDKLFYEGVIPYPYKKNIHLVFKCFNENANVYYKQEVDSNNLVILGTYKFKYDSDDDGIKDATVNFDYRFKCLSDGLSYAFYNFKHEEDGTAMANIGTFENEFPDRLSAEMEMVDYYALMSSIDKSLMNWVGIIENDLNYCTRR